MPKITFRSLGRFLFVRMGFMRFYPRGTSARFTNDFTVTAAVIAVVVAATRRRQPVPIAQAAFTSAA
jgi:hypothetical protein